MGRLIAPYPTLCCVQAGRDDEAYAGGAGEEGDVNTTCFKPDKGFTGADYGKGGEGGPVQVGAPCLSACGTAVVRSAQWVV
mgnify:CR=1 FL=1